MNPVSAKGSPETFWERFTNSKQDQRKITQIGRFFRKVVARPKGGKLAMTPFAAHLEMKERIELFFQEATDDASR
jgi:hypothetical protein